MSTVVIKFLFVLVLAYIALCGLMFVFQRSLIYFPQARSLTGGATMIALPTAEGQVLVSSRPLNGPNALIYFGGNAEDVSPNLPTLTAAFPEHAIYLLHYRGYGGSAGKPTEAALVADAIALFDKIHPVHPNIIVIGRSLGSGVAIHLTSLRAVQRLALVTPYNSILELAQRQFPYLPVRWILHDKFESWKYATQITVPTLLIAAERDEVIPRASTMALLSHFRSGVASIKVLAGEGHNTFSDTPEYIALLQASLLQAR